MKQHTAWSFESLANDIDLDRILREAPEGCRAVEVVIGPDPRQRIIYIRRALIDRAEAAGMQIDAASCGFVYWQRTVNAKHEFSSDRSDRTTEGWVIAEHHKPMATLEDIARQLDAVDAHYATKIRVNVAAI